MNKILFIAVLMAAGCNNPAPQIPQEEPKEPVIMFQDMESCNNDANTPWCEAACKNASYTWCTK